jgi:hypothetical protein
VHEVIAPSRFRREPVVGMYENIVSIGYVLFRVRVISAAQ